jgi:hypothetical protein
MQGYALGDAREQVAPEVEVDVLGALVHEPRGRPPHLRPTTARCHHAIPAADECQCTVQAPCQLMTCLGSTVYHQTGGLMHAMPVP